MSISSMITDEQDRYVSYFETAAQAAKAENPDSVSEILISLNNEEIPFPFRYFRADVLGETPDGATRVLELWLDPREDAQGRAFDLGPVTLEIHPFTWCGVQVGFDRQLSDESLIGDFLDKWLDLEDTAYNRGEPLSGAIHSATQIETDGTFWFLTIDFGTASADALLDLLDILVNDGASRVVVASQAKQ